MDRIDVQWTIAITEALHLGGRKKVFSVLGSQSCLSLYQFIISLFFFLCVSVLQRMTANYRVESHIGAKKSKAARGASLLQVVARSHAV